MHFSIQGEFNLPPILATYRLLLVTNHRLYWKGPTMSGMAGINYGIILVYLLSMAGLGGADTSPRRASSKEM
jgi:hypothetical protein